MKYIRNLMRVATSGLVVMQKLTMLRKNNRGHACMADRVPSLCYPIPQGVIGLSEEQQARTEGSQENPSRGV